MKSILAFVVGFALATIVFSDNQAIRALALFLTVYSGFTWTRFDKLEGCGGSCAQGRAACDCRGEVENG